MIPVLTDPWGRRLSYLRLSVTDRCNFRCYYCMPQEGVTFAPPASLLDFDEMLALVGSSRVDLQACKLEYSIVSPK